MAAVLKLGPSQGIELIRNRELLTSPTMPAIDRYTGVVYDALDAATLSATGRAFALSQLAIHSALFGLVLGGDAIPAYRLSHNSRLPELPLKAAWAVPVTAVLAARDELILDFRSNGYVALGPVPASANTFYLRVVAEGKDGRARALNHFNKSAKGQLARQLCESAQNHDTVQSLLEWAKGAGVSLSRTSAQELELVVSSAQPSELIAC